MSWGAMAQQTIPSSFRSRRVVKKQSVILKEEFGQKKLTWAVLFISEFSRKRAHWKSG